MGRGGANTADGRIDFFVSHAGTDRPWAEWVAWQLLEAGYTVELDVWDWAVGQNLMTAISDALDRSDRVVTLFSAAYFDRSRYTTEEWTSAAMRVPGIEQKLVPVRVDDVSPAQVPAVLRPLLRCDIFGKTEEEARQALLVAVAGPRRPDSQPLFPGRGAPGRQSKRGEPPPRLPGTQPQVWSIPPRNPGFTGRSTLLGDVRDGLLARDKVAVQALEGMGGVGKTQVAIEYAHRFAETYDLAWWVTAERAALIGDRFAALAEELHCAEAANGTEQIRAAVHRELRQRERWLLVFDNADDPDDLQEWLPTGHGHVLITSRAPGWEDIATTVEIDVLARAESVAILRERVKRLDEAEADQLAQQLGDLPLAIAQAAGFMAESGTTAADYLPLLKTRTREILGEGRPRGYPRPLAAATSISADRLADKDPAAAELAILCAFLAPEPIPQKMITSAATELPAALATRAADPVAWGRTLTQLGHSALARIDPGALQMHRLTQAILRDRLSPAQAAEVRDSTEAILAASDPGDPANPDTWAQWAPLMPHLLAADLSGTDNPGLRSTAGNACWYLLARGDAHSGHDLADRLYQQWRDRLGVDHEDTLMMANYLAWALGDLGDYPAARDLGEDTLKRRRRVLGNDNLNTLVTAGNLVATLGQLGEMPAARDLAKDTLERCRRVLGNDNPRTLVIAGNLAAAWRELGETQAALELGEDTLERCRRVLGDDDPRTLGAAANVVPSMRDVGERERDAAVLQAARDLGEDTLDRMRRVLDDDHPTTLAFAIDHAGTLRALGERRVARELTEDTVRRMRRVLGEDHPDTKAAARALAADQSDAGEGP